MDRRHTNSVFISHNHGPNVPYYKQPAVAIHPPGRIVRRDAGRCSSNETQPSQESGTGGRSVDGKVNVDNELEWTRARNHVTPKRKSARSYVTKEGYKSESDDEIIVLDATSTSSPAKQEARKRATPEEPSPSKRRADPRRERNNRTILKNSRDNTSERPDPKEEQKRRVRSHIQGGHDVLEPTPDATIPIYTIPDDNLSPTEMQAMGAVESTAKVSKIGRHSKLTPNHHQITEVLKRVSNAERVKQAKIDQECKIILEYHQKKEGLTLRTRVEQEEAASNRACVPHKSVVLDFNDTKVSSREDPKPNVSEDKIKRANPPGNRAFIRPSFAFPHLKFGKVLGQEEPKPRIAQEMVKHVKSVDPPTCQQNNSNLALPHAKSPYRGVNKWREQHLDLHKAFEMMIASTSTTSLTTDSSTYIAVDVDVDAPVCPQAFSRKRKHSPEPLLPKKAFVSSTAR